MLEQILVAGNRMGHLDILIWVLGALFVIGAVVMLFIQRRIGKNLEYELSELAKLKENNVEYEFVLKAMRLSTWHIDPAARIITFDNDFRDHVSGWNPITDGTSLEEVDRQIYDEDVPRVKKAMDDMFSCRTQEFHQQYRIKIPYTTKVFWEESFAIVAERDLEGKPTRIVGTSMRIDDQKSMEEALVDARNKAEESDRLKTAFIANMSHEIRTPLNAIIGFTGLLPDITGDEERKELIGLIQENNQKLLRIIDDVINISKIESGKEEMQRSTFDLNVILDEVADKYTSKLSSQVKMSTAYAAEVQNVTTDLSRLQEVLNHFVSNAVKFTTQGEITVGYDPLAQGFIRIWVRDTGKGVPDDLQERIFERFFKVDEFIPGAGLGLSICRTMAQSLGGQVGVESQLGQGSTFWLEIPVG